jgi:hypothetical protein
MIEMSWDLTCASGVGRRECSLFKARLARWGAMGETKTSTVVGSCKNF